MLSSPARVICKRFQTLASTPSLRHFAEQAKKAAKAPPKAEAAAAAPPKAEAAAPAPKAASTALSTVSFAEVKFVKEDVGAVMQELPEFNFYEMKEPGTYPYQGRTLDTSILLDPQAPSLKAPKVEFSKLE